MTLSSLFWALGGSLNSVGALFVGGIFGGFANAFYSGSFNALVYETCDQTNRKHDFASVVSSAGTCRHIALAIGTICALIISYFFNLTALAWFAVLPGIGETVTSMFFIEPKCANPEKTSSWKMLKESINDFKKSKKLRRISILDIFDYSLHWTNLGINSLYFQSIVPLWIINIATFIKHILSAAGFAAYKKFKKTNMFKVLTISSWLEAVIGLVTIIANSVSITIHLHLCKFFSIPQRTSSNSSYSS